MRGSVVLAVALLSAVLVGAQDFRPPAVPLAVHNPYFSIWSANDHLYDGWPVNGPTGAVNALTGMVRVDAGPALAFMGTPPQAKGVLPQISVEVLPRETVYDFEGSGIHLTVFFLTPTMPDDLDLLSWPLTYITFLARSVDGKPHKVSLYYDNSAEPAVSDATLQTVTWKNFATATSSVLQLGRDTQVPLSSTNDRPDWGWIYVAAPTEPSLTQTIASDVNARGGFANEGVLPAYDAAKPRLASKDWPVTATAWDLIVGTDVVSKYLVLAFDELESINYFGDILMPYWKRNGMGIGQLLDLAISNYSAVTARVRASDTLMVQDLSAAAGFNYSAISALVFRQAFGACTLTWNAQLQKPWYFLKEISSCGCLQTADVIFPMSPIVQYTNPDLLFLMIEPLLVYAMNQTTIAYNLPWAPHHLGSYPIANLPPGSQENMPVEETANLIIMLAAIAKAKNETAFLTPYWSLLQSWADYLTTTALDPGDQLCTDDFEGPSPHNANLAAKGIVGLGAYGLLRTIGGFQDGPSFVTAATSMASQWLVLANATDHYRLEYDLVNTWSLKYNFFWQRALALTLFPDAAITAELSYYKTKLNAYGVPLDNRADFTKADWESWVAAMGDDDTMATFVNALYRFANETTDRVPFTDWYFTSTPKQKGFRCRPVMGAFFAKMLVSY